MDAAARDAAPHGVIEGPSLRIVRGKLRGPELGPRLVERRRLTQTFDALLEEHRTIAVCATAGSGKTTAIGAAAATLERDVAWLTVDRTDGASGRLVTYLEAAIATVCPEVQGVATGAMADGIFHAEAAAILAEAVPDRPLLLVLDELERLERAHEPWAVLESFLRYAPSALRTVLISRREIPISLFRPQHVGTIAVLGERDLAFDVGEAREALVGLGHTDIDAHRAVDATGGWVIGVLFEAWRLQQHVSGAGGEADPLHGYLASHILEQLTADQRELLVSTSLLDEVTPERAESLGVTSAAERLAELRSAHLPVVWSADGSTMRCHSRFREYLSALLRRRDAAAVSAIMRDYAGLLIAEGHDEEAAEALLGIGEPALALAPAERAIIGVIDRLDVDIAERWLGALPPSNALKVAELMLALAQEDPRRGLRVADELTALGRRDEIVRGSDRAAIFLAWCYLHDCRGADVRAVLAATTDETIAAVMRFGLRSVEDPDDGDGAVEPVPPSFTGGPLDGLVFVACFGLGRHRELLELPGSRWVDSVAGPWRIGALMSVGQTERAFALYTSATGSASAAALDVFIGPELLTDAGRWEEARTALAHGREIAVAHGMLALRSLNHVASAKLIIRSGGDPAVARLELARAEAEGARAAALFAETIDAWWGCALLIEGDSAGAVARLRPAVAGMRAGGRWLHLQAAAVFLAEAEWRVGEEEASDRAADLALEIAGRQATRHQLLQAARLFPEVVSRRIDAEPDEASVWHELGRSLIAQGVHLATDLAVPVTVREFGDRSLLVGDEEVPLRLVKALELGAYLATRPRASASRDELLDALFDGRADKSARVYLRQCVHRLRQVLDGAAELSLTDGQVGFVGDVRLISESQIFESRLAQAARVDGVPRLHATVEALRLYDRGPYLAGAMSPWADQRRSMLAELAVEARAGAAELAFQHGRYAEARLLNDEVLATTPLREASWRLRMRIAGALGDRDAVLTAYRDCECALATINVAPGATTLELLDTSRR